MSFNSFSTPTISYTQAKMLTAMNILDWGDLSEQNPFQSSERMKCLCAERWGIGRIKKDREGAKFLPLMTASCFSTKSGQGVISSKSHFLFSHFYFLGFLITKDAPIFALFDLVAASQVQRCCRGAAAGMRHRAAWAAGSLCPAPVQNVWVSRPSIET